MTRDCNHGQLARSCNICELEQEITSLKAKLAEAEKGAKVRAAIQRACAELPECWNIRIDLERGAGTVSLINLDGDDVEYPSDHDCLSASVNDAINAAIEQERHVPANP